MKNALRNGSIEEAFFWPTPTGYLSHMAKNFTFVDNLFLKFFFKPRTIMAAGINVGGHYKWHFFLFLSLFLSLFPGSLLILPEGVVVGIQIFACGPELPIE